MTLAEHIFRPEELQVVGDPSTGGAWLKYRMPDGKVVAILLPPELLGQTVLNLTLCAAQSPNEIARRVPQLFAIRDLHAGVAHASVLVLKQEIEAGWSMETTLEFKDAERLIAELQAGLAAARNVSSGSTH